MVSEPDHDAIPTIEGKQEQGQQDYENNQARPQKDENSSGKDYPRPTMPKERVVGARKIWGTLRTTTSNAVSSTLSKLTSKGNQVQVKCKLFKTQIKLFIGGL